MKVSRPQLVTQAREIFDEIQTAFSFAPQRKLRYQSGPCTNSPLVSNTIAGTPAYGLTVTRLVIISGLELSVGFS